MLATRRSCLHDHSQSTKFETHLWKIRDVIKEEGAWSSGSSVTVELIFVSNPILCAIILDYDVFVLLASTRMLLCLAVTCRSNLAQLHTKWSRRDTATGFTRHRRDVLIL